ncbi:Uma2 family endonuclease [Candidatus Magnetobacterium casense]|uniref:Uma2 family endonuclease n=1 Tax=Candidatus Magnetobacterium casense TaxID=1455061 RepID=A0ABS6S0A0_9BACT|nr:Uma2 family endonuclease [Candidatus Magnetobacterium casensis]MBV6342290.1 Uma2 family endonuclease [Candidatus Magnetobacterium casensis]
METISSEISRDFDLTEIIDGEEIMTASPFLWHQEISQRINRKILLFLEQHNIGKVYYSPLDVILEEGINRLQPDLLFIRRENLSILQDWVRGVPDMVCEIVSKGSMVRDMETKKRIYERYKVSEYWVVAPEYGTIEIFILEGDRYKLYSYAEGEGTVRSLAISGLNIDVMDIFGD